MIPHRVQRKRTKGWQMPPNTVYVGRPTRWGNPFPTHDDARDGHGDKTGSKVEIRSPQESVKLYRKWLDREKIDVLTLRGKNLACWCPLDRPCHADVLLKIANARAEERNLDPS